MTKLINFLKLMVIISIVTSCSNVLDKKIDNRTIDDDIKEIKTKNHDLDSLKLQILDKLFVISKGRTNYIQEKAKNEYMAEYYEQHTVADDKFKETIENLFYYFKVNNITYKKLFTEIDLFNVIDKKYDKKLQPTYKEIDLFCNAKQYEVERKNKLRILSTDYEYKSPQKLNGYCPYLDEQNKLKIKIDSILKEKEKEIRGQLPVISTYKDILDKLYFKN